jgi:hypothetical protein
MKIFDINSKTSYVNDGPHWFGPFNNDKALELFFEDSQEEQWFAAVRNTIVLDVLNALKRATNEAYITREKV